MKGGTKLDCDAVIRQLWDYLDGELDAQRAEQIAAHLAMCQRCYPQFRFELAFLEVLTSARQTPGASPSLRERIVAALGNEGLPGLDAD